MMFHPFDLVQYGIVALAVILCILAIRKADKLPPKIISSVLALMFVASIPYIYMMRYTASQHDYSTKDGLLVRQGSINKCEKEIVETWTKELFNDWESYNGMSKDFFKTAFIDSLLICLDAEKLTLMDKYVRGYQSNMAMTIGWNGDLKYTESLFKHEGSHHLLELAGIINEGDPESGDNKHHALFKKRGLGY